MIINKPFPSQIFELRALWKEAFDDTDDYLDLFFRTGFCENRCRCITLDGKVVATLYWFDCCLDTHKIAYIYAVATIKSHRGQGLGHKLMEDTHSHLKSLGYTGALLVPGSNSLFQYYADMGYRTCSNICEFECKADFKNSLTISEIDKTEYARLRKQFLPSGSVIQENENLDFLETLTKFYTGSNFLLAASVIENPSDTTPGPFLYGWELLGDTSLAPCLVNTLGCTSGSFRTYGNDRPFTMLYLFDSCNECNAFSLTYFAFAFD